MTQDHQDQHRDKKDVILIVDGGAWDVLHQRKETTLSPTDIRRLAEARGVVKKAVLFTDEFRLYRGINPLVNDAKTQRNNRIKKWTSIGFQITLCPRGPRSDASEDLRKETIDSYLMEEARHEASLCRGREREVRFIFVIGDEDYLPLTRTFRDAGFSVTIFITNECAFMDSAQAPHIEERLLLFKQGEKGSELHQINKAIHQNFGTLCAVYTPTERQASIMDRFAVSESICPRCGESVINSEWRKHRQQCGEQEISGVDSISRMPQLPMESDIRMIIKRLESLGPKALLEWVLAQKTCGTVPSLIRMILNEMHAIPWDAVEVAMGIHALGRDPMEIKEAHETLTERALQLGYQMGVISDDGEEVCVREGIFDGLAEFIEEAGARSCHEHIARVVSGPNEGALKEEDILYRTFLRDIPNYRDAAASVPQTGVSKIESVLLDLSVNELLFWLTDRQRIDRMENEVKAAKRVVKNHPNKTLDTWVQTLTFIELNLSTERMGLEAADLIAERVGADMTAEAVSILIQAEVLRRYVERGGRCARGYPSHPAFVFAKRIKST